MATRLYRTLARVAIVALLAARAAAAPAADELVIGQSTALSGPLGELGVEANKGARVAIDQINARGGVHGRSLRMIVLDDGYDPARTEANVKRLVDEDKVFAVLGVMGTPNNERVLPWLAQRRVPTIAPLTGATALRNAAHDNVFHVRASYGDEARKIVQHLATIGSTRVAIIHQNNSFGRDAKDGFVQALAAHKLEPLAVAAVENSGDDARTAVQSALAAGPNVVVLGTAGKPTIEVIKALNQQRRGLPVYALSVMGTRGALSALGPEGVGVVVSQVMPFPWNDAMPLVKEYQQAMRAKGFEEFSFLSLEGYLNVRVLAEALQRSGPQPTRDKLVATLAGMHSFTLSKLQLGYAKAPYVAYGQVDLSIIAPGERFRR